MFFSSNLLLGVAGLAHGVEALARLLEVLLQAQDLHLLLQLLRLAASRAWKNKNIN